MCEEIDWQNLIRKAVEKEASDIHMTVGQRPYMRCLGILQPMDSCLLTEKNMSAACSVILNDCQREKLAIEREIDLSWTFDGRRFRVHAYYQQGWPALAFRLLPERIPSLAELGAPKAWQKMKDIDQGLILVTGRTGSGKSTTLAAFIEELNHEKSYHIVTLEDPIEYILKPQQSFISQRELGRDFLSFSQALRSSLREAPDVIMVGEIRDAETMQTAMAAAATGVLVLGTLHSQNAEETALRVEGLFPLGEQAQVRAQFAEVLTGIFAQRLLPGAQGGRVNLTEVLLAVPAVRSLLRQGKYNQLSSVMLSHGRQGMQTAAMAMDALVGAGCISREVRDRFRSQ